MAEYMSMEHLKFLLHEVHNVEEVFAFSRYQDFDKDSVDILLDTAKSWADQDWFPFIKEMDDKPAYFKDGKVFSHPQLKKIFKDGGENGWIGMYFDHEHGGMQVPMTVGLAITHILEA
ncbi:MAG TPA: acyl-CoA dehydrogenase N-terminal domain-containing protein, partial [Saprospiraceae bacterium]|nr:acyl-CoA dehydrogenase N-terminal domain-containing protein [Saprospiraceae bacterium]